MEGQIRVTSPGKVKCKGAQRCAEVHRRVLLHVTIHDTYWSLLDLFPMTPDQMHRSRKHSEGLSQLATGCVTCHACHGCVTDFRPILGNPVEVTHVTSLGHVYIFPR